MPGKLGLPGADGDPGDPGEDGDKGDRGIPGLRGKMTQGNVQKKHTQQHNNKLLILLYIYMAKKCLLHYW